MYQLLLVDDDIAFCRQLAETLDWEEFNFHLCGLFQDGQDALEYIQSHPVDAVISDIKMPILSGLDLSKACFEQYPHIQIALVSAYRDFEYARQAIAYNVTTYITKPVTYTNLREAVSELSIRIRRQRLQFIWTDNEASLERQRLFSDWLLGLSGNPEHLEEQLQIYTPDSSVYNCPCALVTMILKNYTSYLHNTWKYGRDRLTAAIRQIVSADTPEAYVILTRTDSERLEFLFLTKKNAQSFRPLLETFLERLIADFRELLKLESTGIIKQTAESLLALSRYSPSDKLAFSQAQGIASRLIEQDFDGAYNATENVLSLFNLSPQFILQMQRALRDVFGTKVPAGLSRLTCTDKIQYLAQLRGLIDELKLSETGDTPSRDNKMIHKAVQYIHEHYAEDISLESVASYVCLHPVYFSKYFKQYTKEKFVDFVNRVRIEKAKSMLERDPEVKTYHVGESVGFKSIPHFYKLFKLYTGFTPAEYKKTAP